VSRRRSAKAGIKYHNSFNWSSLTQPPLPRGGPQADVNGLKATSAIP